MKNTEQLNILFQKYLNQRCSPDEISQLLNYFDTAPNDDKLLGQLIEGVLNQQGASDLDTETRQRLDTCLENIMAKRTMPVKTRKIWLRPLYIRWAVAATLFVTVGAAYFYFTQTADTSTTDKVGIASAELKPGKEKAILTLADGTVIDLEQAGNGKLENKAGVLVTKTADGKLIYDTKNGVSPSGEISYNTLVTPRGGQYKVILPDGSAIWLNAASSLRFPTHFVGDERRVELSGEGYFEIKKNTDQPFVVVSEGQEVTVLGTHFNINAYRENNFIKTTLLEGAVKINKGEQSCLLAPGQEASLSSANSRFSIEKNVDVDAAIAWKEGRFSFDETNIKEVMQQISRWYDVEVVYKGDFSNVELTGLISRAADASDVLKLLKGTQQVDFIISGRIITVIPYK